MRLTLRTLLNWINQNLSESDSHIIAQKVEESELAKNLKTQIETVMEIPDLPALNVLDGTPLGNANSTAEYLDNSMLPEKTQDFERFCIHSDMILAEAASCHFILSRVLTEMPEPSPQLRGRLLSLYQYIGTDDEYSLPPKQNEAASEKPKELKESEMFSELPSASSAPRDENAPVSAANSGGIISETVSESLSADSASPNYWKFSTLALCALFLLWLLMGIFLPDSIPGRMLRAAYDSPVNSSIDESEMEKVSDGNSVSDEIPSR